MQGLLSRDRSAALVLAMMVWFAGAASTRVVASDAVRVEIWEGLPEPWAWQVTAGEPSDTYTTPALGISRVPARYNERGIEVDRSNPFALHAEATFTVPPGPGRFLLRSRNAARLLVDGHV